MRDAIPQRAAQALASFRVLTRHRALAMTVVVTLALSIGANTAILSAVRGVVFRPLPYPHDERLVHIWAFWPGGAGNISFPDGRAIAERSLTLEASAVYQPYGTVALTGRTPARSLEASFVTPGYFDLLGGRAAIGRLFSAEEDSEGASGAVAVLSDAAWVREFGGDPGIVGRVVQLNGLSFEVVGVLPGEFADLGAVEQSTREVFLPTAAVSRLLGQPPRSEALRLYWGLARLKNGVSVDAARGDLARIAGQMERERPATHRGYGLRVQTLSERIRGGFKIPTLALLAGSVFILLIGCANVANLLLLRLAERRGEMSLRAALGASSGRVVRMVLGESLILAGLGGLLGTILGVGLSGAMATWAATHVSPILDVSLDPEALFASIVFSALAVCLVALLPARDAHRLDLKTALGRGRSEVNGGGGLSKALLAIEVAFAMALLSGAGLMVRSYHRLTSTALGFRTDRLLTFRMDLAGPQYQQARARVLLVEAFLERARAVPGVESATVWGPSVLGRATWVVNVAPAERHTTRPDEFTMLFRHSVSPGGLAGLGIERIAGRDFGPTDTADAPLVGIVSESVASELWPGQDAVGRRLVRSTPGLPPIEVIGVARDARHRERYSFQDAGDGFIGGLGPQRDIYLPYSQRSNTGVTFAVRLRPNADPTVTQALARAAASLDPDLPLTDPRLLEDRLADQERQPRALALLLVATAAFAALLAATGIYGVVSHAVGRRTREIGLRMALGAERLHVARLVLAHGAGPAAVGAAAGLLASAGLGRAAGSLLFDIPPNDPVTLTAVTLAAGLAVLLASLVPARRALGVDPAIALRAE